MDKLVSQKFLSKDKSFYLQVEYEENEDIRDNFKCAFNIYNKNSVLLNSIDVDKKILKDVVEALNSIKNFVENLEKVFEENPEKVEDFSWRLPDKDELNQMYRNLHKNKIGGFADGVYWSSSEGYDDDAWFQDFGNGSQSFSPKDSTLYVRAVRAFKSKNKYQVGDKTETGYVFSVKSGLYKEAYLKDYPKEVSWNDAVEVAKKYVEKKETQNGKEKSILYRL